MVAPTSADMDSCDPKCRCAGGPYINQAFACDDPCAGQGVECTFDCANGCDCGDRTPGIYRVRVKGGGTYQQVADLDICYAIKVESYFDGNGDAIRTDLYQFIDPTATVGPGTSRSILEPMTDQNGPICFESGSCTAWPNIQNRRLRLLESYCDNFDESHAAGSNSGSVSFGRTRNGVIISVLADFSPTILWAQCDLETSQVDYQIDYIGEGEIIDFFENPNYIGSNSEVAVVDCSDTP